MNKKIIAIVLVAVMITFMFSGCTFIKANAYREANQELASVTLDGITMTITQNELLDYFNSNAQNVMQNLGYDVFETMEYLLQKKVESKYLLIKGISYLSHVETDNRKNVLFGNGTYTRPEHALTYAEYYNAIKGINEQLQTTVDTFIKEFEQEKLTAIIKKASNENIDKIEFADDYLQEEYLVGDKIDTTKLFINITYDAVGTEEPVVVKIPVSDRMITTAFDSSAAGEKSLVVSFDEKDKNEDEETVYNALTVEHKYKINAPRATKTKDETEKDPIDNRYASLSELPSSVKIERFDINKKGETAAEIDALRRLRENLKSQNKDINYFFNNAFESALMTALQFELAKTAPVITDANALKEYEYLKSKTKGTYDILTNQKAKTDAFNAAIKTNLETLYYFPSVPNMNQYFYVQQILFNFSDDQKEFLKGSQGTDEDMNNLLYEHVAKSLMTKESNPNYDPKAECEFHQKQIGTECSYKDETVCKTQAYLKTDVKYTDVYAALNTALTGKSGKEALDIFTDYLYRYNDDPGVMNNSTGYLIPPKGVKSDFYASFVKLGRDLFAANASVGSSFLDGKLAYTFTDYGVHILMISMLPFEDITEAGSFGIDTIINIEGKSYRDIIKKQLKSETESKIYSDYINANIKGAMDAAKINQKKIDKLLKDFK